MLDGKQTMAELLQDVVAARTNLRECEDRLAAEIATAFVAVDADMIGWAGIVSVKRGEYAKCGKDGPWMVFSFDEANRVVVTSQRSRAPEYILCELRIGDGEQTTDNPVNAITLRAFFSQKEAENFLLQRGREIDS